MEDLNANIGNEQDREIVSKVRLGERSGRAIKWVHWCMADNQVITNVWCQEEAPIVRAVRFLSYVDNINLRKLKTKTSKLQCNRRQNDSIYEQAYLHVVKDKYES